jgi:hypothetical protein
MDVLTAKQDYEILALEIGSCIPVKRSPTHILHIRPLTKISSPSILYPTLILGDSTSPFTSNLFLPISTAIAENLQFMSEDLSLSLNKAILIFIITSALFGNGQSSTPSNTPGPELFPDCVVYGNVHGQHKLLNEVPGVKHVFLAFGWSMGTRQA